MPWVDERPAPAAAAAALRGLVHDYETLSVHSVPRLVQRYHPQASFKDPFNQVQGRAAIAQVFDHMFAQLQAPRFVVRSAALAGAAADVGLPAPPAASAFLTWDFHFGLGRPRRARTLCIHGASRLVQDADGLVLLHRDYWDAAEELYAQLPLLGWLMRALQRRLACPEVAPG